MRKNTTVNFFEYAIRWREQPTNVNPPIKRSEMIDVFLQVQKPDYFHFFYYVVGKTFVKVIKIGEMVENGIKYGKVVSQARLRTMTHENGKKSCGKENEGGCSYYRGGDPKKYEGDT